MANLETYHGTVRSPHDALILFEACRLGHLPRVQRRPSKEEALTIRSGSVFVWDEDESGLKRWTDDRSWRSYKVSGTFVTYKERTESDDKTRLIKQSFSITTLAGRHLHLVCYFSASGSTGLLQPSKDPNLRHIKTRPELYPSPDVWARKSGLTPAAQRTSSSNRSSVSRPPRHAAATPAQQGPTLPRRLLPAPPRTSTSTTGNPFHPPGQDLHEEIQHSPYGPA